MKHIGLFAGALFAAGIAACPASAQQFDFEHSTALLSAYASGTSGSWSDYYIGPGTWDVSTSQSGAYASSTGNTASILAAASADANSIGYAYVNSYFTVASDTTVDIAWDFSGDLNGFGPNLLVLYASANYLVLIDIDVSNGDPVSGHAQVTLLPGIEYQWATVFNALGGDGHSSFASLTIVPAPSGFVVLGLAFLSATRGRRGAWPSPG